MTIKIRVNATLLVVGFSLGTSLWAGTGSSPLPLTGVSGSRFVKRLAAGEPQTVVLYGTSLTARGPWVGQMQNWLTNTYTGSLTLVNSGASGKNSKYGLKNLDRRVLGKKPDAVFIEFGMNDAFSAYPDPSDNITVEQARTNLLTMIDRILAYNTNTEIILQTMNPAINTRKNPSSAAKRVTLEECYQMYRDVAAARGLMLIDHYVNWKTLQLADPATFLRYVPDGLHPVAAGTSTVMMPLLKTRLSEPVRVVEATPPVPYGHLPSERQLKWHELEMYAFCCLTVNTFTAKEWGYGDESESAFNPTDFNANAIVSVIKESGLKGVVLACKHHE
jgi:acyl-CoA thioesterase-1